MDKAFFVLDSKYGEITDGAGRFTGNGPHPTLFLKGLLRTLQGGCKGRGVFSKKVRGSFFCGRKVIHQPLGGSASNR